MSKSKVYFTDLRTHGGTTLLQKLEKLVKKAGLMEMDFENRFTAIKIHFGEPGNVAYLRPNFSRVIVDMVREAGGKPFLTDCNTLYVGRRKDALEHLDGAYENGYNPFATHCQMIIADGLKGTDDVEVPVDGEYVNKAKIGRAIMDADILISMTHFKGHENTGFGGTIKNIGMGSGSRRGKMEMHAAGKPSVLSKRCRDCKVCGKICAFGAIRYDNGSAAINHDVCVGCGRCMGVCAFDAIVSPYDESFDILNRKMAEYTLAVVKDRPQFHISFVMDVSPFCDCHAENDLPIIQDVGIFASTDPVALDQACADACNAAPVISGSYLDDQLKEHDHGHDATGDRFCATHPDTDWRVCLAHGEKIGLGSQSYELITVK